MPLWKYATYLLSRHHTSIVASVINLVRPMTVASLLHWASAFVYDTIWTDAARRAGSSATAETCFFVSASTHNTLFSLWCTTFFINLNISSSKNVIVIMHLKLKLETVSIAEPLQNRQHAHETLNAVNTRREREWEGELKARREEEGN